MLEYQAQSDRYIGHRYAIPAVQVIAAVRALVADGWDDGAALEHLLDETLWSPESAGVETLLNAEDALDEIARILRG